MNLTKIYNIYFKKNQLIIISLILALLVIIPQSVYSQSTQNSIPTITWNGAKIPSWGEITFSNMPSIAQSGSFNAPPGAISQVGYDPSRSWNVGQTPDQYMMLGDFQDSFKLQNFTLDQISSLSSLDVDSLNLHSFEPIKFQTIESLVEAIPSLNKMSLSQVKPINDLINNQLSRNIDSRIKIGQILKQSPILKKLKLNSLQLEQYSIDSIPGLSQIPIAKFKNWQVAKIAGIPGLNKVPFDKFPNPINIVGSTVGIVDVAFETAEQQIIRTVSGSDQQGFAVPCDKNCAHVELSGDSTIQGKAWISGKYNLVRGGRGVLGSVNGGKEPTGRHPFGSAFKVIVWNSSEKDGTISQALFSRVCMRNHFVDLGCTPYFIGPIPFLSYRETEPIFVGLVSGDKSDSVSTPAGGQNNGTGVNENGSTFKSKISNSAFSRGSVITQNNPLDIKTSCSNTDTGAGVNIDAFNAALSNLKGNYDFIGNYLCDQKGNCGRPLGSTQFMSYNPDVRKIINSKPGGSDFLARLDAGKQVTTAEMLEFFTVREQKRLTQAKTNKLLDIASQKIDPYTGQKNVGERLLENAAQMHFAGTAIPPDIEIINSLTQESSQNYGEKITRKYSQIINSNNCL